jgi:hypothetical protein
VANVLSQLKSPPQSKDSLDPFGHRMRTYWKNHLPKTFKSLQEQGQDPALFLKAQDEAAKLAFQMKGKLPPGGIEEILRERFFPLNEREKNDLKPLPL